MLDVVIDRKTWNRGGGKNNGILRNESTGKMCCLGFACIAAGYSESEINGFGDVDMPYSGRNISTVEGLLDLDNILPNNIHGYLVDSNDNDCIDDKIREQEIIEQGKRAEINFTFVN